MHLGPWMKVKVQQTGTKLQSSIITVIIANLKEIGSQNLNISKYYVTPRTPHPPKKDTKKPKPKTNNNNKSFSLFNLNYMKQNGFKVHPSKMPSVTKSRLTENSVRWQAQKFWPSVPLFWPSVPLFWPSVPLFWSSVPLLPLTLSWRSKCIWVTFHISRSLVSTPSTRWPVNRNVHDEENLPLVLVSKGCTSLFWSLERRSH